MTSWGIAEWYGRELLRMTPDERREAARSATDAKNLGLGVSPQPPCPFQARLRPGALCTKVGGVCSIRKYTAGDPVTPTADQPATVCPNRFLSDQGGRSIFREIAFRFYGSADAGHVLKEIPFLERAEKVSGETGRTKAGRIDWIVVPQDIDANGPFDWIAVETQAVYFSGTSMFRDIDLYAANPDGVHYPANRRPDFRSSGAKRLAPQLDAKSPVVRRWGHKIAVVVDRAFADDMPPVERARDFDDAEVVWLIMRYGPAMELQVDDVIFSGLDEALRSLQGTNSMTRAAFERTLRAHLQSPTSPKVYRI